MRCLLETIKDNKDFIMAWSLHAKQFDAIKVLRCLADAFNCGNYTIMFKCFGEQISNTQVTYVKLLSLVANLYPFLLLFNSTFIFHLPIPYIEWITWLFMHRDVICDVTKQGGLMRSDSYTKVYLPVLHRIAWIHIQKKCKE